MEMEEQEMINITAMPTKQLRRSYNKKKFIYIFQVTLSNETAQLKDK